MTTERNYIVETIMKVDRLQKECDPNLCNECDSCEASLVTRIYNTIPLMLYGCNNEPFKAYIDETTTTHFFKVESVREKRYATLRLLTPCGSSCTRKTCIFDLDCCCCLECFDPINCCPCGNFD